jgi:hypothetical protein
MQIKSAKKPSPWAHAGAEPSLRDLLIDSIVISVMTKDRVSTLEILQLLQSVRHKILA